MELKKNQLILSYPNASIFDAASAAASSWGARVFRAGGTEGDSLRSTPTKPATAERIMIGAEWWFQGTDALFSEMDRLVKRGTEVWIEVTSASQASMAAGRGAQVIVAMGYEGGGWVGDESTLVLLRRVLAAVPDTLRVVARGAIGPDTAAACLAAGAFGVMLDNQMHLAVDVELPEKLRKRLSTFNALDTVCVGMGHGFRYRFFGQVATPIVREILAVEATPGCTKERLWQAINDSLPTDIVSLDVRRQVWTLGQDAAFAATMAAGDADTQTILANLYAGTLDRLTSLASEWPLGAGCGIAKLNQTAFPLHQGPMAQVSDAPGFAKSVAQSGAMPWLALANMPTSIARTLVQDTRSLLDGQSFGAGIIGLDANRFRDEHIAMLKEERPPFVLVAAGTIEQAQDLESAGVDTYLHTPTPGLVRAAIKGGLSRFVLEGSEAGGHVGSLGGLALWQLGIFEVEAGIAAGLDPTTVAFVPAGGLGDEASTRALGAALLGLARRGVSVGLQLGTAYLMCDEAVESGAITRSYQDVISRARETTLMGETVRTPTRVLPTPQAAVVLAAELDRRNEGEPLRDRKEAYEHANFGGLRAAAKAQKIAKASADKGAVFQTISLEEQLKTGLFHAGQSVALLEETTTLKVLNERMVNAMGRASVVSKAPSSPASVGNIAIVGVGAVLPDAENVAEFLANLKRGHYAVTEVPADRWDASLVYSEDRKALDKTYSKIGGFVTDFVFDRKSFRVPPSVVPSLDRTQQIALEAARQALEDAGALAKDTDFPLENCAIIVGNSQGGDSRTETTARVQMPRMQQALAGALSAASVSGDAAEKVQRDFETTFLAPIAPITEDTMAGELPNCIAGRIASTFDLGGANWVVDAACASSLAAFQVASQGLRAGSYDAALVGGADCLMGPEGFVKFSKIGALSHDGSKPFDTNANGFVMGEGAAMFVLMREEDARARGANIYAIVRGTGASSDGRGKGITAPNPRGQHRAIRRAYADAGVDPQSVTMFEAHGTGTPVGDPVEVNSLVDVIGQATHGASLGSVKSNIGHLKAAAGAAAMLKATLALHHKELFPTLNVKTVNPKLPLAKGGLHLQRANESWAVPAGVPRRAGVSAFGFGGTNVHIVMEEVLTGAQAANDYEDAPKASTAQSTDQSTGMAAQSVSVDQPMVAASAGSTSVYDTIVQIVCERTGYGADELESDFEMEADLGIDTVKQAEIMAQVRDVVGMEADADFRLSEYPTLGRLADYVTERLQGATPAPKAVVAASPAPVMNEVTDLVNTSTAGLQGVVSLAAASREGLADALESKLGDLETLRKSTFEGLELVGDHRLVIAFDPSEDTETLTKLLTKTVASLRSGKGLKILANKGVYVGAGAPEGDLAFLFPGQGSQYLGMCGDLRAAFPIVQATFDEADEVMSSVLERPMSSYIDPPDLSTDRDKKFAFVALTKTEITQPAMLTADIAILRLLNQLGFKPSLVAGHSLGEYGACVAAGVMDFATALKTVAARGTEMANVEPMDGDVGLMAALAAGADVVQPILDDVDGYVVCANKNCHAQTVIGGSTAAVKAVMAKVKELGIDGMLLPVSHAFHTRVVAEASAPLKRHLQAMEIHVPALPILSNVTGGYYPESVPEIVDLLSQQVAAPVEFIREIERMYADGARTFVEVGPKRAQTGFVANILDGKSHLALYTNHPKFGGLTSLRRAVAQMLAAGFVPGETRVPDEVRHTQVGRASQPDAKVAALSVTLDESSVYDTVVGILCEQTGYAADEIEADFELEADLGIDTVKQAEIMAKVREVYAMEADADFRLAEYPSLNRLVTYVMERTSVAATVVPSAGDAAPAVAETPSLNVPTPLNAPTLSFESVYGALVEIVCEKSGYDAEELEPDFELEADLGIDTVKQAEIMAAARELYALAPDPEFRLSECGTLAKLAGYVLERAGSTPATRVTSPAVAPELPSVSTPTAPRETVGTTPLVEAEVYTQIVAILCEQTGYDPTEIEAEFEMEADLGIDTVKQAEIMAKVREVYSLSSDDEFRLSEYATLARLTQYVLLRPASGPASVSTEAPVSPPPLPVATQAVKPAPIEASPVVHSAPTDGEVLDTDWDIRGEIVCSGISVGVPGQDRVFGDTIHQAIFDGRNHIHQLADETVQAILDKNITRLQKGADGTAQYVPITDPEQSVHLAGQLGEFDLSEEFGIEERLRDGLDKASQLAFAAGLDALRNAHIPLVPRYRVTRSGKKVTNGWALPESMRNDTGIIFASCFTGIDVALKMGRAAASDPNFTFDPRFLLQVIGMGHARFAEFIGARGPNTRLNVACASTTQGIGVAEDWLRLGRCKRVIIIGGDDVTEPDMMEWVGSGFLATGAGTNESDVTKAALPFDKRRNGTILGAGAVGIVLELAECADERGVVPLADLISTRFANSAFHATRLDVDHIAGEFDAFITEAEDRYAYDRKEAAAKSVFVSHETFTPARGGSAAAEIESLRSAFGEATEDILITNIKGYTGHPMGAGLEDFYALKSLHIQAAPPVPNLKQPDESLGNLRYSKGEKTDIDFAIRFAAGFGSQLAMVLWRRRSRSEKRLHDQRHVAWLSQATGFAYPKIAVAKRVLRVTEGQASDQPSPPERLKTPVASAAPAPHALSHEGFLPRQVSLYKRGELGADLGAVEKAFRGRHVVLAGAPSALFEELRGALKSIGSTVTHLVDASTPFEGALAVDLGNEDKVHAAFEALKSIDGIISLLGRSTDPSPDGALRCARESFHIARAWQRTLGQSPGSGHHFISAIGLGGNLGLGSSEGAPLLGGAISGMTKGLAREWPDANVKLIDLPSVLTTPNMGVAMLTEVARFDGRLEVALNPAGAFEFDLVAVPTESKPSALGLNDGTTWLLTGGGRGITASIAQSLAQRFGGGHFILTGRSAYDVNTGSGVDLAGEKQRIRAALKAAGARVTPMAISQALRPFEAQAEIGATFDALTALGATVEYLAFDVADAVSAATALNALSRPVDVCVHGAGIEDSHLLMDKDPVIFDRVMRTKLHGATHLYNALGHGLKAFVTFSSVAGRFGNQGQVDYAAANDALNKWVFRLNADGKVLGLSVDWTAWSGVGMATRGSIQSILEGIGVELLPHEVGAPVVGALLASGLGTEVLVSGKMGDMAIGMNDGHRPPFVAEAGRASGPQHASLFDTLKVDAVAGTCLASTTLDPTEEAFLFDHAIENVPVLPGVFGMELFAQAAKALNGSRDVVGFEKVVFERPVKFHRNAPLSLEVEATNHGDGSVEVALFAQRTLAKGRVTRERHFTAKVLLGTLGETSPGGFRVSAEDVFVGPDAAGIYEVFFHTGVFQVLGEVPLLSRSHAVAYGTLPENRVASGMSLDAFVSDPFTREMALQAAGILGMHADHQRYLPAGIDRVEFFGSATAGERVVTRVEVVACEEPHHRKFNVECCTADGRVLQRLSGNRMIQAGPLPEDVRIQATPRPLTQVVELSSVEAEDTLRLMGLGVQDLVNPLEYESYHRLISTDRKREWVAARVAAKSLVRDHLRDMLGTALGLPDIVIAKDEFGAPSIRVTGGAAKGLSEADLPAISMTHSHGRAMVSIAPGTRYRIGVDLELVEERSETFSEYFSAQERGLTLMDAGGKPTDEASKITALWCLKESTTKALGLGFHLALSEIMVQEIGSDGRATLALSGRASDRLLALGATHVDAWVRPKGSFIVAETMLELDTVERKKAPRRKSDKPSTRTTLAAVAALLREKGLHTGKTGDGSFVAGTSKPGEA